VANILQWVECFNAYTSVVLAKQPSRANDLLGYSSLMAHAARKYKGDGWIQYDINFRKRAAAFPSDRWAEINPTIWQLAFANAEPRSHCELCFSLDHNTEQCDEYEPPTDAHKGLSKDRSSGQYSKHSSKQAVLKRQPICLKWNQSQCHSTTCEYQHICIECHQAHKSKDCSIARRYTPYQRERQFGQYHDQEFSKGKQPFRSKGPTLR
jgi:hypothetical protein